MRKLLLTIVCLGLLAGQIPGQVVDSPSPETKTLDNTENLERTVTVRGTQYTIKVNTTNHTVLVSAVHLSNNTSDSGYVVLVNDNRVIDVNWESSEGETNQSKANLMYHYDARKTVREVTFSTYGGSANLTYNFTVPRKHEGRFLRPTVTDVEVDRVNESWGRITVTVRSDAQYYYPAYVLVWMPDADVKLLAMHREKGENVTRESFLVPVEEGAVFEGEIRLHPRNVSESGPLHSQYEFSGRPGATSLSEVPYEPVSREAFDEYSYRNESRSTETTSRVSDELFRTVVGGIAVVSVLGILITVVVASRRRV